ncbi:DUF3800 domain-containing protein [Thermus thermophilus]|uniref:DUF3800 domain-containing protein n=1 Tax=Thermus thermophilus TaxID=274 RepID=UPI001FCB5CB3|nr:DUF3800 domain-containing protein [Thermus thermophilus]BDG24479.1 hypothetical protein TthSNM33_16730 [Thermus thermophilus]
MLLCFVDESGDHILDRIDPYYPIFVLVGLLVDEEHYETVIVPEMAQIKRKLFGHDGVVFHTADITRNRNGFERLKDPRSAWSSTKRLTRPWQGGSTLWRLWWWISGATRRFTEKPPWTLTSFP